MAGANSGSVALLPPGQRAVPKLMRFGVPVFAARLPRLPLHTSIAISGAVQRPFNLDVEELQALPRRRVTADFHCVTTWSVSGIRWSGFKLSDVIETLINPRAAPSAGALYVRFICADGAKACVDRRDLDGDDVILADCLNGEPLPLAHGAPLRLVAPHLYGFKNAKHIKGIEFCTVYKKSTAERMTNAHPRGRVAREERGRWFPGWLYRYAYRGLIGRTVRTYERAACNESPPAHVRPGNPA